MAQHEQKTNSSLYFSSSSLKDGVEFRDREFSKINAFTSSVTPSTLRFRVEDRVWKEKRIENDEFREIQFPEKSNHRNCTGCEKDFENFSDPFSKWNA